MTSRSDSGRPDDYDEIDQIYDYVRGFAPLPKSAKGWHFIGEAVEDRKERFEERKERKISNSDFLQVHWEPENSGMEWRLVDSSYDFK